MSSPVLLNDLIITNMRWCFQIPSKTCDKSACWWTVKQVQDQLCVAVPKAECALEEKILSSTVLTKTWIISIKLCESTSWYNSGIGRQSWSWLTMFLCNTTESRQSTKDECACYSVPVPWAIIQQSRYQLNPWHSPPQSSCILSTLSSGGYWSQYLVPTVVYHK